MTISIIVASYNRKSSLEMCVKSILAQTYTDWELIIIDDGSTDGTELLFSSTSDSRIRYIRFKENQGATIARNKGLDEATGTYTLVWDSDDTLDTCALETLRTLAHKHPNAVTISAPTRVYINGSQAKIPQIPEGKLHSQTILCALMPKYKLLRMVLRAQGGHVRYKSRNLDFMVNSELSAIGLWWHHPIPLGNHYILSDAVSLTRARRIPNPTRSIDRAPHLTAYLERFGETLLVHCPGRYSAHAYGASLGLLLAGNVSDARHYSKKAVQYAPRSARYCALMFFTFVPCAPRILFAFFRLKRFVMSHL
jgi:glycosyltransferase involved in cell wall biosynthesis